MTKIRWGNLKGRQKTPMEHLIIIWHVLIIAVVLGLESSAHEITLSRYSHLNCVIADCNL